ncbi:hypothetical protein D3C84_1267470 [compost metagenome]
MQVEMDMRLTNALRINKMNRMPLLWLEEEEITRYAVIQGIFNLDRQFSFHDVHELIIPYDALLDRPRCI